jgi:hypothetical protein
MKNNYWQPDIDNWIINENDATAFDSSVNSAFSSDIMAKGVPVESNEEEEHEKLNQPYRGIDTFDKLKKEITRLLNDIRHLAESGEGLNNETDVYEIIIKKLDEPDLIAMLDIASKEVKKRNITSF